MAARNRTKLAVLGFLTWKPMSGYEIKKAIEGSIANFWSESYGQIYPILQQLAHDGLATRETTRTGGGRPQHIYAITPEGRAELARWLAEPAAPEPSRNELLLKLFFANQIDVESAIAHLTAFEAENRATIAKYEEIARDIARKHDGIADAPYWLMTLRFGLAVHRAMLGWAAETLGELEDMRARRAAAPSTAEPAGERRPRPNNHKATKPRKPRTSRTQRK
ncbi:MAG: PadR family transcriptional regulator [Alphaproteobacteria bacterium]